MKIIKLTAENIKKLKAVEISPTGALVQVTGPNGSGKSSVLDCIFYALAGTSEIPSKVVREGEERAYVKLDLGDMVVTRKFTAAGGTSLIVEAQNGARFPSPQKMLDALIGSLSFDPLAFARMQPKEQLESLRRIVKVDVDIDALDAQAKAAYDSRTVTNRQIKALETRIDAMPPLPANVPDQPVDFVTLMGELDAAEKYNAEIEKERQRRESTTRSIANRRAEAQEVHKQAEALLKRVRDLEEGATDMETGLSAMLPLAQPIDTVEIKATMAQAQETNSRVAEKQKRTELATELRQLRATEQKFTETIELSRDTREKAIAQANMPVPGLSFGDGEVIYNNLPLAVASDAERLRVSVAIAMAANPQLRVLRIKDGSLLDENSLAQLAEMTALADYQVWIERVESPGKMGVVMEDGTATVVSESDAAMAGV